MSFHSHRFVAAPAPFLLGVCFLSCASSDPNADRVLTSITVNPAMADARNYPNGQVLFTATGTFSLPPLTGPVTFAPPYSGDFVVDNLNNQIIANVVASGSGTVTVECAAGAKGSVDVTASASANNGTATVVSGSGQLTCP